MSATADQKFNDAFELYNQSADAPGASQAEQNAAKIGRIFASYGRSLLAKATGDAKAKEYLDRAVAADERNATSRTQEEMEELRRFRCEAQTLLSEKPM